MCVVSHETEYAPTEDADAVVLANRLLHELLVRCGRSKTCLFSVGGR